MDLALTDAPEPAVDNNPNTMDNSVTSTANSKDEANVDGGKTGANDNSNNSEGPNKGSKDYKYRLLPLPDPIPEEMVKRYPMPSKDELNKKVAEEDAKIKECFERLTLSKSYYEKSRKIRDDSKPAFDSARKQVIALNDECRNLFEERKTLSARIKELRDADMAARSNTSAGPIEMAGAGKDGNDAIKNVRNMDELDARIAQLKYRHETESMSIAEEKRIIAQISFLTHRGRDYIRERDESIKNEQAAKEARGMSRRELEEARTALDTRIDEAKEKLEAQKKLADKIRKTQDDEHKKLRDEMPEINRDEERQKITDLKTKIRNMHKDYQNAMDQYRLNERIHAEQLKIAKKKKWEAINAERQAKREAWEAEQAQYPEPHPYQNEKDMCAGLTVYLQTLLGETVEKPNVNLRASDKSAPSLKSNDTTRVIEEKGQAIGKSVTDDSMFDDLAFSDFIKKSSKSKGKKGRRGSTAVAGDSAAGEGSSLKPHSIDYLTAFSKLDIKPPNKMSEVRTALEAVKAKAAFYETAPAPTEEEKAERVKKTEGKGKKQTPRSHSGSAMNGGMVNDHSNEAAFPGLKSESSDSRSQVRDSSWPSFSQIARGVASSHTAHTQPSQDSAPSVEPETELMDSGVTGDEPETGTPAVAASEPPLTEA